MSDEIDRATRRAINKQRTEEIRREKISESRQLDEVERDLAMLEDGDLSSTEISARSVRINARLKLLNKVRPEVKSIELNTGDDGMTVNIKRKRFDGSSEEADDD